MVLAITKANELAVPLLVCGDLHDSKANIRGECIKAILDVYRLLEVPSFTIVANHDRINEKSEEHSLEFLRHMTELIEQPKYIESIKSYMIPYHHDAEELRAYLKTLPKGSRLIMHQGVQGSNAGHYIQDKSAISIEDVADFRVLSGHYHQRQDIKTGRPRKGAVGLWTYLGNPYTLGFGEANDPDKGFNILFDDGTVEFVPTDLRKHIIFTMTYENLINADPFSLGKKSIDLVWVKIIGSKEELSKLNKKFIGIQLGLIDFKLDLIANESKAILSEENVAKQSQPELLDGLIASLTNVSDEQKVRLQTIWKELIE